MLKHVDECVGCPPEKGCLGLSIVRSILEKHNVPFGVDSKEGEGTSFWFELPLAEG